jgi:hypothetical protein
MRGNRLKDAGAVRHHIQIAEPKGAETSRRKIGGTPRIVALGVIGKMLSAIDFDDQSRIMADEIDDVGAYRDLPAKMRSPQTMSA